MLKLCFFVPESHLQQVKMALFEEGAGRIGDYDCCCWQVKGQGQFRPLDGSKPFLGQAGRIETIDEYKVEMVCDDSLIAKVVDRLLQVHPYEVPAYDVMQLLDIPRPSGRGGG